MVFFIVYYTFIKDTILNTYSIVGFYWFLQIEALRWVWKYVAKKKKILAPQNQFVDPLLPTSTTVEQRQGIHF